MVTRQPPRVLFGFSGESLSHCRTTFGCCDGIGFGSSFALAIRHHRTPRPDLAAPHRTICCAESHWYSSGRATSLHDRDSTSTGSTAGSRTRSSLRSPSQDTSRNGYLSIRKKKKLAFFNIWTSQRVYKYAPHSRLPFCRCPRSSLRPFASPHLWVINSCLRRGMPRRARTTNMPAAVAHSEGSSAYA